jgi:hypothetical protein
VIGINKASEFDGFTQGFWRIGWYSFLDVAIEIRPVLLRERLIVDLSIGRVEDKACIGLSFKV